MSASEDALALVTEVLATPSTSEERLTELAGRAATLAGDIERLTEPGSGTPRTADHVAAALLADAAARIAEERYADRDGNGLSAQRMIAIGTAAAEARRIAERLAASLPAGGRVNC
jgi:hypothetical protein